jgi:hypothetical protein
LADTILLRHFHRPYSSLYILRFGATGFLPTVTHPPHDGLCVPRLEVCCLHPCSEATGVTIQVSSPCYWCPLVRK